MKITKKNGFEDIESHKNHQQKDMIPLLISFMHKDNLLHS